jgi:hypothetical protein
MARTLSQVDTALAAVEVEVPANYAGMMETLRQHSLVIESEIQTLLQAVGSDGTKSPVSGIYNTLAALQTLASNQAALISTIQTQITTLQSAQTTDTTQQTSLSATIANLTASITSLDIRLTTLQNQVTALTPAP